MKRLMLLSASALLTLSLAACDNKPEVVTSTAPDPLAAELKKAAKVELPPSVKASVTFRCKDNSLVYVDFFSGDKLATLKTSKDGAPVRLTAENAGDPLKADGYSLTGTSKSMSLTQPGKGTLTCKT